MKPLLSLLFLSLSVPAFSQVNSLEYIHLSGKADSLYQAKNYAQSAETYSLAFQKLHWKPQENDHYQAACAFAMLRNTDKAFENLSILTDKLNYRDLEKIKSEPALNSLHRDKRWCALLKKIKKNKRNYNPNRPEPVML